MHGLDHKIRALIFRKKIVEDWEKSRIDNLY